MGHFGHGRNHWGSGGPDRPKHHVFKVGGPIPWSRVLLPFYRKKLDRSTQFGAVGNIITLYSSKSYVKSWGSVQILGKSGPPTPGGCAHGCGGNTRAQTLPIDAFDVSVVPFLQTLLCIVVFIQYVTQMRLTFVQ